MHCDKRPSLYAGLVGAVLLMGTAIRAAPRPNIIYILADDLGYNELGCYGQTRIKTPNIDALAADGMRFTQHYAGSAVCAPTRGCFLTGLHSGHGQVRNNSAGVFRNPPARNNPEGQGQYPLARGTQTIGNVLQKAGYKTCVVGKWGLGGPDNSGSPNRQGFDHFFGYLCQRQAHNYYPTHLWRNENRIVLDGNKGRKQLIGKHYAPDLMFKDALAFIDTYQKQPFFLYYATIIPHVALQVPEDDPGLAEYRKVWPDEEPYTGSRGYLHNDTPHATYAAMITRLDRYVGQIVDRLKELGIYDNTLIVFTSDNGPTNAGGGGASFFDSAGELRALKGSLYEGGIRVPLVATWGDHIEAGVTSDHVSAGWDMLATFAEVAGATVRDETDGISILPTLLGEGEQQTHEHLYWELGKQQAIRKGDWKGYRRAGGAVQLYDLAGDPGESTDVAADHPDVVQAMERLFVSARTEHDVFRDPTAKSQPKKKKVGRR